MPAAAEEATGFADYSPLWWSSSPHGECLGEHRKIAVMSEAQFSEFIFLEPRDGIVFVQRDIDRSSRPTFDQPDLHVERVGMDLLHGRAGRHCDVDPELLVQLPSKRRAGKLSRFHMSTG
jgi:hypothetical protein